MRSFGGPSDAQCALAQGPTDISRSSIAMHRMVCTRNEPCCRHRRHVGCRVCRRARVREASEKRLLRRPRSCAARCGPGARSGAARGRDKARQGAPQGLTDGGFAGARCAGNNDHIWQQSFPRPVLRREASLARSGAKRVWLLQSVGWERPSSPGKYEIV
jgi:hypothetical protein